MRILGIDPGTYTMGVGVVDTESGNMALVGYDAIQPPRGAPLPQRLHALYERLVAYIAENLPAEVAIEEPFVARNSKSAIAIGQAQAIAFLASASVGLPVHTYQPTQVKHSVTDHGGSSKEQVQEMVSILLGLPHPPKPDDASDALAVAICHINSLHTRSLAMTE